MERIALFGGSFNPPHQGHLDIIRWLVSGCPLDLNKIWVLPTVNHAFAKDLLPYEVRERLLNAMLDKAFLRYGAPSPARRSIEVVRHDEAYMVETLEKLHADHPGDEFVLVVGADILNETDKWERWADIEKLATVLPVTRVGVTPPDGRVVHQIDGVADTNSTDIRQRLAEGDLTYLVGQGADLPEAVQNIIEQEGLYGYKKAQIEQAVRLDTIYIPVTGLTNEFAPGDNFALTGDIKTVLGISAQNHTFEGDTEPTYCFGFRVLRDTGVIKNNEWAVRRWLESMTDARRRGAEFTDPRPQPHGPTICYLKVEGEPVKDCSPGKVIAEADGHIFFEGSANGLFGGLFGL